MSYDFYKIMHFVGIFLVFASLGGQIMHYMASPDRTFPGRKLVGASHGIGLLLVLVGGFGLLARLQIGFPGWIYVKLAVWILLGGIGAVVARKRNLAPAIWWVVILLGGIAAYAARVKPF